MQWLWMFLPDEAMILVIALIGLGLMVGLLRLRSAGQLLGGIVLMLLLAPFIESFVGSLPSWVSFLLLVWIGWAMIRALIRFILGARAADHMVGILAADAVRGLFGVVFFVLALPFRLAGWLFRRV
ncbi:MAG TPA: hypothetical protein VFA33_22895 [Bryobacteraceae bacterium]|nr:hypothetical protein [Bryobacteraceae bacterium]